MLNSGYVHVEPDHENSPVVAVDKDWHSHSAFVWAIENLLELDQTITLVHVESKPAAKNWGQVVDPKAKKTEDVLAEFRKTCEKRNVSAREIVLQGEVQEKLLDYIKKNHVTNIVLGASMKTVTRKLIGSDVPTFINKAAPEYCSVYVIVKGKIQSARPNSKAASSSSLSGLSYPLPFSKFSAFEPEENGRSSFSMFERKTTSAEAGKNRISFILSEGSNDSRNDIWNRWSKASSGDNSEISSTGSKNSFSRSFLDSRHDIANKWSKSSSGNGSETYSGTSRNSPSQSFQDNRLEISNKWSKSSSGDSSESRSTFSRSFAEIDLNEPSIKLEIMDMGETNDQEAGSANELERLRREMKQAMAMYNNASKETVSPQVQPEELGEATLEETSILQQAKRAEERARMLLEIEKAKVKAALETADKAKKLAEREARRRKYAEQRAKREEAEKSKALGVLSQNDTRYRKYTIEEIEEATDNFSKHMKIGEGGYGPVFRGKLDHTPVAIKVLRPDAAKGKEQFQQEVEVLSTMRHPNMVLLMGACPEFGCLVYEYMDYGSLEDRLFRKDDTPPIPWAIRFKIAADIATGLLFLHQAKPEALVHRDLKPANILLDRHYMCKISDVGLARLVPPTVADTVTQYHMTSAAGTFCYIDPEYQKTGMLGTKSDVYSLGVLLLQIITARPPMGLTHQVESAIEDGNVAEVLDPTLPDWPIEEATSFANLALQCAELRKRDRPDLATIILPELNRLKEFGMKPLEQFVG